MSCKFVENKLLSWATKLPSPNLGNLNKLSKESEKI